MASQRITAPSATQKNISFTVAPEQTLEFAFDLKTASFERPVAANGNVSPDLVILLDDGSKVELKGFFVVEEGSNALPTLQLEDGTQVKSADFLAAMDPSLDVSTAAGPAQSSSSSGLSAYDDGAGALLGGTDRLGSLGSDQFSNAQRGGTADALLTPSVQAVAAAGSVVSPVTPVDPVDPVDPDRIARPTQFARAALLQADGVDNPVVSVNLGQAFGLTQSAGIRVLSPENSNYNWSYNTQTGAMEFTLKDSASGVGTLENFTIIIGNKSYVVQVTSTPDELKDAEWSAVTPEDIVWGDDVVWEETPAQNPTYTQNVWAGVVHEHMTGSGEADKVRAHVADANTGDLQGSKIHLQMNDSSLLAHGDETTTNSLELNLGNLLNGGSLAISNEDMGLFTVFHDAPIAEQNYWGSFDQDALKYNATVVTAMGASGKEATNTLTVEDGDVLLHAGGNVTPVLSADKAGYVSGTYAGQGATNIIEADNITVTAAAGAVTGATATVTGVRSDGAAANWDDNTWSTVVEKNSQTTLTAKENVNVGVDVAGDTATDHSGNAYAAVAATERGHVDIEAGSNITITTTNSTTGDNLNTAGVYGIYSGYGLGANDLPNFSDLDKFGRQNYGQGLAEQYYNDTVAYDPDTWEQVAGHDQSIVNVNAAGDVAVNVNLDGQAGQEYAGEAVGVKTFFGDVNVTAGGNISVSTVKESGAATGNISAVETGFGALNMKAEGGIDLSVRANGENLSVLNFNPLSKPYSMDKAKFGTMIGENITITGEAGMDASVANNQIVGIRTNDLSKNQFAMTADEKISIDVTAHHNGGVTAATGIAAAPSDASDAYHSYMNNYYYNTVLRMDAPEVEIAAKVENTPEMAQQGTSTATAISAEGGASIKLVGDTKAQAYTLFSKSMGMDYAQESIESLKLSAQGAGTNIGIKAVGDNTDNGNGYGGRESSVDIWAKKMEIEAKGDANNPSSASYGIMASSTLDPNNSSGSWKGGVVSLNTTDLTISVDDPNRSVGIHADNFSTVKIESTRTPHYDAYGYLESESTNAMTVVINCTITNGTEQLRGIAIEALNGGNVLIQSREGQTYYSDTSLGKKFADSITLNGDVHAGDMNWVYDPNGNYYPQPSEVIMNTGAGADNITINGSVSLGKAGTFSIYAGEGNDTVSIEHGLFAGVGDGYNVGYGHININTDTAAEGYQDTSWGNYFNTFNEMYGHDSLTINGGITMKDGGMTTITTGAGNDMVSISGGISAAQSGSVSIDAGDGNDAIMLHGKMQPHLADGYNNITVDGGEGHDLLILKAPDAATFQEWYKDWLSHEGTLENLHCEGFIVQGVDNPSDAAWLTDLVAQHGNFNVQFFGSDVDLTMINDASAITDSFALDGTHHANDVLYVRFDGDTDSLHTLASAVDNGHVKGIENVLLDMADGSDQNINLDGLNSFIGSLRESGNDGTNVILRADNNDTLQLENSGWSATEKTENINGVDYTVYQNENSELHNLYVQLVTSSS